MRLPDILERCALVAMSIALAGCAATEDAVVPTPAPSIPAPGAPTTPPAPMTDAAPPPPSTPIDLEIARFEAQLEAMGMQGFCAVLVHDKVPEGQQVRCGGHARPSGAAPDADTLFDLGSITKTFVAELLAAQVLEGVRCYDDPIIPWLANHGYRDDAGQPQVPAVATEEKQAMTLLELATHTAGLPRNPGNVGFVPPGSYQRGNLYYAFNNSKLGCNPFLGGNDALCDATDPFAMTPGTTFSYSNFGFHLLGWAVSRSTPWSTVIQTRFLSPLGMDHTGVTLSAAEVPAMAWASDDPLDVGGPGDTWPGATGGGGMHASARDLSAWMSWHMGRRPPIPWTYPPTTSCSGPHAASGADPFAGPKSPVVDPIVHEVFTARFDRMLGSGKTSETRIGLAWNIDPAEGGTIVSKVGAIAPVSARGSGYPGASFLTKTAFQIDADGGRSAGVTVLSVGPKLPASDPRSSSRADRVHAFADALLADLGAL